MKAERRHELKTNALARGLEAAPFFLQQHGTKILAVLVVAILVFALIRYRAASERENLRMASESLAQARAVIGELQTMSGFGISVPEVAASARQALDNIPAAVDDPTILAETLIARGDLNWALANRVEMPNLTASTQPVEKIQESNEELLRRAENAYKEVISRFPDQTLAVATAHLSLGAIFENRADWDAARKQYETVRDGEQFGNAFKQQAELRLALLDEIKNPLLIAPSTQPATVPPTAESTSVEGTFSTTTTTTAPATQPTP